MQFNLLESLKLIKCLPLYESNGISRYTFVKRIELRAVGAFHFR